MREQLVMLTLQVARDCLYKREVTLNVNAMFGETIKDSL